MSGELSDEKREVLAEIIGGLSGDEAVSAVMQELASAHGLAVAAIPIPDGVDKMRFVQDIANKIDKMVDDEADKKPEKVEFSHPSEILQKMLRQKAEMERANIQHCEHNSRSSLALQVLGITLNTDHDIDALPEYFTATFKTACNTLRDAMTGAPVE